jgi:ATP-dependent DNA helicase RecG
MATGDIQLAFDFKRPLALLAVDEIYEHAAQEFLEKLREDRRIERKPSGIQPRALGDYFSMWANTLPDGGILAVGLENDGIASGCSSLSQDKLNSLEQTGMVYCPDARYQSKRIAVIRPDYQKDFILLFRVCYRPDKVVETVASEAFARIGDSKVRLSQDEVRELQIDKRQIDLEREPIDLNYPEDFDIELIQQFSIEARQARGISQDTSNEEILELRRLGKLDHGNFLPNVACALAFAKDPGQRFPGCKIRFLRFDGEVEGSGERFNAVKDISIEGPVPRQIEHVEQILLSQIRDFTRLGPDQKFYTAPEYPKPAWYEAIVNACVHRSYGQRNMNIFVKMFDDRLVIESPGGLPPFVTPENIYNMHQPRNPNLMDAMFYLKFVKAAHEGTRRIRDTMAEMNLPKPEFEQIGSALVRVTLRNNKKQRKVWIDAEASEVIGETLARTLSADERRVINFLAEHKIINVSQVQRLTSKTWPAAKKLLVGLQARGILEHNIRASLDRDPQARFVLKIRPDSSSKPS